MASDLLYEIKPATKADRKEIVDHLRQFFFRDEPLNACLKLITEENATCPSLEEYTVRHLDDGINLMAVKGSAIIGICLCVNVEKGKEDPFDCKDEKYNKIVKILDYAEQNCDAFKIFPDCSKGAAVQVISVNPNYRSKGIAVELLRRACKLAKERGLDFINITCTGAYSAKLAEKLNFELKYILKYSDYKENGIVVFKPQIPHTSLNVYLKKL